MIQGISWLFWLYGPFRKYLGLYRAVSQRDREGAEREREREKEREREREGGGVKVVGSKEKVRADKSKTTIQLHASPT